MPLNRRFVIERFTSLVVAACVAQLIVALVLRPGCLIIDEVTYHAMTRALVRTWTLGLDNGWDIFASPELEWEHARAVAASDGPGRLVAQYPYGFPVLASPLYAAIGVRAFFALNTVAFYGTVLVTRALAFHILRKRSLAVAAALVFALGTYAWEYSLAMWPHAVTLFLSTAAVLLAFRASEGRTMSRQLKAGALVGVATTMRLDAIFAMAAVVLLPAILPARGSAAGRCRGSSLVHAALGVLGAAPAFGFLSVTNHAKFGTWAPLSYGPWHSGGSNTGFATYLPLAIFGALTVVAVHAFSDPETGSYAVTKYVGDLASRWNRVRASHGVVAAALLLLVGVVIGLVPALRLSVVRALDGLWMILIDLRHSEPNGGHNGLSYSPRGAMMYVGALKKSFVQSLPWLPLAIAAPLLPREPRRRPLIALAVPFVVNACVFGALGWHGGLGLNLRYLLPALPFAAILATRTVYRLARRAPRALRLLPEIDVVVLMTAAAWFVFAAIAVFPASLEVHETFFLDVPLAVAVAVAVALVLAFVLRQRAAPVGLALSLLALVWAGMTAATYDAVATIRTRTLNRRVAASVRALAPPGSVVFSEYPDLVSDAMDDGDVIAQPTRDGFAHVGVIVVAAAARGRSSYAILTDRSFARLRSAKSNDLVIGEPLAKPGGFALRRLESSPEK